MERVKRGRGVDIREQRERLKIQSLLLQLRRERREIGGLLSRDAERAETRFAERRDIRGRHRSSGIRDPLVHRAGLCERDLLLEHEQRQRFETGLASPQRWGPMPRHDVRETRLVARERTDSPGKCALIQ